MAQRPFTLTFTVEPYPFVYNRPIGRCLNTPILVVRPSRIRSSSICRYPLLYSRALSFRLQSTYRSLPPYSCSRQSTIVSPYMIILRLAAQLFAPSLFSSKWSWSSVIPNLSIKSKGKAHPCKVMSARSSDQPILPPLHWEPVPL